MAKFVKIRGLDRKPAGALTPARGFRVIGRPVGTTDTPSNKNIVAGTTVEVDIDNPDVQRALKRNQYRYISLGEV